MKLKMKLLVATFVAVNGFAAANVTEFQKANYHWFTKENFADQVKTAKQRSGERKIANAVSEEMMSPEFRNFRDRFLKITTSEQYDAMLNELEAGYSKYPTDMKYVAARMAPLKNLRGFLYKLTPVMEREKITHSYFLTVVRRMVAQMTLFFPFDHADATFEYFAKPYMENGNLVSQYKTLREFQNHLGLGLYPSMIESANRIASLNFSKDKVIWDNKIMNGSESFVDDIARFRILGEAERNATMFRLHRGMAFLNRFVAYNIENLMPYVKDMGKLYGIDGFFSEVDGAPSYVRVKVARKKKYKDLFTLSKNGKEWMTQSLGHIQESVKYLRLLNEELKDAPANSFARINPVRVAAWEREINSGLETLEAVVNGPTELRSPVTGEVIQVNLPAFYTNPPSDMKKFLPIAWDTSSKTIKTDMKVKKTVFSKNDKKDVQVPVEYRNYYWGRPTAWNASYYKTYFPSIKNDQDVARHIRIFRQSFGASTIGTPITDFTE